MPTGGGSGTTNRNTGIIAPYPLKMGSQGNQVIFLQGLANNTLAKDGKSLIEETTGIWGSQTEAAIEYCTGVSLPFVFSADDIDMLGALAQNDYPFYDFMQVKNGQEADPRLTMSF